MSWARSVRVALLAATLAVAGSLSAGPDRALGAPPPRPSVVVLVIDGLEPDDVGPVLTPNLHALMDAGEARRWTNARGVMVSETNPNHTAMLTGAYPETSGLIGNAFFDLRAGVRKPMESPSLIMVPTLFDAIEAQQPDLRTASIMGKEKLRRLFDCAGIEAGCSPPADNPEQIAVSHVRPDFVGGASTSLDPDAFGSNTPAEPLTGTGYALDTQVMDIVIAQHSAAARPHFTFVNLGGVDGFQHLFGARSGQAKAMIANADANVGRFVEALKQSGRWADTVLFVLADHSFQDTGDPVGNDALHVGNPITPRATGSLLVLPDLLGSCANGTAYSAVSNGGSASVYIRDPGYDPYAGTPLSEQQKDCLAELRTRALANPHVAEALYRLPVGSDPATQLTTAHPDWHIDSPRLGELFLVARDDSSFADSRTASSSVLTGNHGGPTTLPIPFFAASGSTLLVPGTDGSSAGPTDIAPTVAWLLGIEPPSASEGRVLREAFGPRSSLVRRQVR